MVQWVIFCPIIKAYPPSINLIQCSKTILQASMEKPPMSFSDKGSEVPHSVCI